MRTKHLLTPVALVVLIPGCQNITEKKLPTVDPPNIQLMPKMYQPFFGRGIESSNVNSVMAGLPYQTITMSRYTSRSTNPSYEVTFQSNQKAKFIPLDHSDSHDIYEGEIDIFSYGRLCYLIDQAKFKSLQPKYQAHRPHAEQTTLTVISKDGSTSVSDIGNVGPIELWGLFQTVDSIRHEINWHKASNPPK